MIAVIALILAAAAICATTFLKGKAWMDFVNRNTGNEDKSGVDKKEELKDK